MKALLNTNFWLRVVFVLVAGLFVSITNVVPVVALSKEDAAAIYGDHTYYEDAVYCNGSQQTSAGSSAAISGAAANNKGYNGQPIWTADELTRVAENQSIYEQAAQETGVPWQMLAVLHRQEHGLEKSNPTNGQGLYQLYSYTNGGTNGNAFRPAGPVDDAEFLRQSVIAANVFKEVSSGNNPKNRPLDLNNPSPNAIKDTFFGYNGRAGLYRKQAAALGFDPATEGYEGSPYVMNKADSQRDPAVNKNWLQFKSDGGNIQTANSNWGAWLYYAVLAGISPSSGGGSNCSNSTTSGTVNTDGYSFPVAPQKKSENGGVPGMSSLPCQNASGCHHDNTPAFDMSRNPGGDAITGTAEYAISDGTIKSVKDNYKGQAGCFSLQLQSSKDQFYYAYLHTQNPSVQPGQQVKAGQQIAEIGPRKCTGNGSDSHLHIDRGCLKNNQPQLGGSPSCRDPGIVPLMNKLFEELPA